MFAMAKKEVIFGLILALFLAVFISPFASQLPGGLEKTARNEGFLEKAAVQPLLPAPLSNYLWPGIKSKKMSSSIAGLAGTLVAFIFGSLSALALKNKKIRK